jgi:hypothetical protein
MHVQNTVYNSQPAQTSKLGCLREKASQIEKATLSIQKACGPCARALRASRLPPAWACDLSGRRPAAAAGTRCAPAPCPILLTSDFFLWSDGSHLANGHWEESDAALPRYHVKLS